MDKQKLLEKIARIKWWHTIDLGEGVVTPGLDDSPRKLEQVRMPADLSGISVLDVGAWDGFFSFEAERRGAKRVLAVDTLAWDGQGWSTKQGFELARRALDSRVEDKRIDVLDLSPQTVGIFDLVLFLGVLYHMRYPLLALERVASVTGKQLILETHVDLTGIKRPAMAFYPGSELDGDASSWWGPNPAAVEAMLKTVGFREVHVVSQYSRRSLAECLLRGFKKLGRLKGLVGSVSQERQFARMVFHAWK